MKKRRRLSPEHKAALSRSHTYHGMWKTPTYYAWIVRQATGASSLDVFDSLLVEMIEAKRTAPKVAW